MIALVDYGAGNLTSVRKALAAIGAHVWTPTVPGELARAHSIIVPGVGHFDATRGLTDDWRAEIKATVAYGTPLLGICVGIATLIYVPRLGSASPTTGLLWELEANAAVIVGGAALKGGSGTVIGTVVGAILLSVISNILNLTSLISVYLNAAVQGFVIIIVAFLQKGRR